MIAKFNKLVYIENALGIRIIVFSALLYPLSFSLYFSCITSVIVASVLTYKYTLLDCAFFVNGIFLAFMCYELIFIDFTIFVR